VDEHRHELVPVVTIPDHLVGQVQSKLAYVDEWITGAQVVPAGDRIMLLLREAVDEKRAAEIDEKVQRVVTEMTKGSMKPKVEVLEDFTDRPLHYNEDPMVELFRRGEVHEQERGLFTVGPLVTRLIDYFYGRFQVLADSFDAQPYRFPTLMSAHFLERVNYFQSFPHSLTFATHLREDLDIISEFAASASCDEHGLNSPAESFSPIKALLSPATCYHLYFSLADSTLPVDRMVATATGNCFRYESNNLTSLERLWNFTMQEVILVGSKDFVLEHRELGRKHMQKEFEQLGLAYRVESANDPFFVGEFRKQAAFQSAFQLKFEIRAPLPFNDSTLAIGSYNYHQDFFGRNLDINLPNGSPIHTGCIAFGLERVVYAFLARNGFDPANWPVPVQEALL
jgi:seryl-tRNA synthetase